MIDDGTSMYKTSPGSTKSAACPGSRNQVSTWVRESCWRSSCYGRLRITSTRSWTLIWMAEITLRMRTCISCGTVIASITTLLRISPMPTITWATCEVQRASIQTGTSQAESRWKTRSRGLDPKAGGNLNPRKMSLISRIATFAGDHKVHMTTFTGRCAL